MSHIPMRHSDRPLHSITELKLNTVPLEDYITSIKFMLPFVLLLPARKTTGKCGSADALE